MIIPPPSPSKPDSPPAQMPVSVAKKPCELRRLVFASAGSRGVTDQIMLIALHINKSTVNNIKK